MKKKLLIIIFMFTLFFSVSKNVFAECSYDIRKQLLEEAKKVSISIETIKNNELNIYTFKFTVSNVTEKFFIKYYNDNNGVEMFINFQDTENGVYSFIDEDAFDVYDYYFTFYTNSNGCIGSEILSSKKRKPMYNTYSNNVNCSIETNKNFKYCKEFLEEDYKITTDTFYKELEKYNKSSVVINKKEEKNKINFFEKYNFIIISVTILICILGVFIIYIIKKKKYDL